MKIAKLKIENYKGGYTIIETMIAVSLFIMVIMAGMGSLLNANLLHQKSQNMRSIMDNLSFIMEDISRNLRTGYNYRCVTTIGVYTGTASGEDCFGVAFQPSSSPSDPRWVYEIVSEDDLTYIRKSTDNGATWVQLTPNEVVIDDFSSFAVLGAEGVVGGNRQQPLVTIRLSGEISDKNVTTPFSLQTSASARLIDI